MHAASTRPKAHSSCTIKTHEERVMRVFASVAHRGSANFLPLLLDNTFEALRPYWTCVFSEHELRRPNATMFIEKDSLKRRGTFEVPDRYFRCFAHVLSRRMNQSSDDVLVFVASNQRFFTRCRIEPNTFSLTPLKITLLGNVQNPFRGPIGYPSANWNHVMNQYANRLAKRHYDAKATFVSILKRMGLSWCPHLPNAVTHAEVSAKVELERTLLILLRLVFVRTRAMPGFLLHDASAGQNTPRLPSSLSNRCERHGPFQILSGRLDLGDADHADDVSGLRRRTRASQPLREMVHQRLQI